MLTRGSRVKYIKSDTPESKATGYYPPIGTLGTIHDINTNQIEVKWDEGTKGNGVWWCNKEDVEETFSKSDLKNGDVVKHNNGEVGIVIVDVDAIIYENGSMTLGHYRNNLTCIVNSAFDIVAVKRPSSALSCQFNAFDNALGKLIYEREKKVEEMTLAEVCGLLGKEIKIIR